ncbi:hypothetical protein C1752_00247 [Acaryochloris thomasi RCC1774]|uniref:DUF7925 domain-containing protein n=2 Tax=Acaryochloris TaxID=155977 RepID=A0A2W1JNW9_9CYAN|nr:hypothetical protein C1752_00247 [Acaryochloris thomasi RCC1774]
MIAGGLTQSLLPAFAAGTAAGVSISNTATATYRDAPGGNVIDATSNTVNITVAEVAGVTAVASGFNDTDGGAVEANDILEFTFDITNIGNAATDLFIPGLNGLIEENFDATTVEIISVNGTAVGPVAVLANGSTLGSLSLDDLDPDAIVQVRVTGTPAVNTPAGADVGVTIGNTGPNNNSPSTQNQPDDPTGDGTNNDEIRTVDADAGNGAPVNGEREASAENSIPFASSVDPLALATVTKEVATLLPGAGPTASDDLITYNLGLTVEGSSPNAAFVAEDLVGTPMTIDGSTETRILVSDAIPAGTVLNAVPTAPAGWEVVYSTNDPSATAPIGTGPNTAAWIRNSVTPLNAGNFASVERVGFIRTATTPLAAGTDVTATTPFQFTVITSGLAPEGGQVANIAQVFGRTFDDPAIAGSPTDQVVYDESGDSQPNNFNDNQTPPNPNGSNFVPAEDRGVADPVAQGTDTNGDNTGSGPDGEANVVNIGNVAGADDILNGTDGVPGAQGPTDQNDDFTNLSTDVPVGTGPADTFNPAAVTFDNTIQNPSSAGFIADVTLQPISPTQAENADDSPLTGQYDGADAIPFGTQVTITATDENGDVLTATYTYVNLAGVPTFRLDSSTTTAGGGGAIPTPGGPVHVNYGDLPAGQTLDYTVSVDLPPTVTPNQEISIPVVAFPDDNPTTAPGLTGESTNNITIDRIYTGFMQLTKQAQVLDQNGVIVQPFASDLTGVEFRPGYQIDYRIGYENISTPVVGTGNVGLTAFEFEVVEDGTVATGTSTTQNNWAAFTDHEQNTSATQGDVEFFTNSGDATPLTTTDPLANTQVEKYENPVGQVDPGQTGEFQFRRRLQ